MKGHDKGLSKARKIYEDREKRIRELRTKGEKIFGYICCFAPPEIITAAGLVPFRLTGDPATGITVADSYIEKTTCPYIRNLFDRALRDNGGPLDGLVLSHSCDSVLRVAGLWGYYIEPIYLHVVNVPHNVNASSVAFYRKELDIFKKSLEAFIRDEITDEKMRQSVELYNKTRLLVKNIYEKASEDPPKITGVELREVLISIVSLPPEEGNELMQAVLTEVENRSLPANRSPRILLYGSIADTNVLPKIVEESGGMIVVDDNCIGTRTFRDQIEPSGDVLDDLARYYFEDFQCPRTERAPGHARFHYINDLIDEFKIDGVILYAYEYCDPHKFDIPVLKEFLSEKSIPSLYLEDDYSMSNLQSIKTRIQAFVEMLE